MAAPLALAGVPAAALHFSGALKSAPVLAPLPFDLALAAALALAPLLLLLAAGRRWRVEAGIALPLAACAGLWSWLVVAGLWTPSRHGAAAKLPEAVLLAPLMLGAGLLVGADAGARRALCGATLLLAPLVAASIAHGLATGSVVLGGAAGANPDLVRVQYQLSGLLMACAAGLAAVRAAEAGGAARLGWLALVAGLAAAALLPGGRTGLAGLAAAVLLAPAARHWSAGRPRAALGWVALGLLAGLAGLALLLADPERAEGLRTLERLTGGALSESARPTLWAQAAALADAPWGLGTGGFTLAAGYGENRGLYPHNHAVEALVEGGWPGLALWLGAFGGGTVLLLSRLRALEPGRAGRLVALALPVGIAALVSTDLGNRMVWFALGLALSAAVSSRERSADG